MRIQRTVLWWALLAVTGTAAGHESRPSGEVADRLLAALQRANGVPGMGASVMHGDDVVWAGSVGMQDVEAGTPVNAETVFRLASVSKLVTATAAARLAERGQLDLDAPVQPMLPWLTAPWAPLTSRQLAAHTSGLPHYQEVDAGRGATRYASVQDAVKVFADRPLLTPPGTAYGYSSWGYTLLSAVVEARAGRPFLDYVAEDVAPGLGIGPDRTDEGGANVSRAYGFTDGVAMRLPPHDFSYTWGGGGLSATPTSIARFGARVLAGDVVSPATFASLQVPTPMADGRTAGERGFSVGFGWRTSRDPQGRPVAHHAGVSLGARSALVLWPGEGVSASLLSNASWVSSIEQTTMVLASAFEAAAASADAPNCPVDTTRYEAVFDGQAFTAAATFAVRDGVCEGSLALPAGPLRTWLNGFPQRDAESLVVMALDGDGGMRRAALITPIGLHGLQPTAQPKSFRVELATGREVDFTLR